MLSTNRKQWYLCLRKERLFGAWKKPRVVYNGFNLQQEDFLITLRNVRKQSITLTDTSKSRIEEIGDLNDKDQTKKRKIKNNTCKIYIAEAWEDQWKLGEPADEGIGPVLTDAEGAEEERKIHGTLFLFMSDRNVKNLRVGFWFHIFTTLPLNF
jgi:hypothetical protein